MNRSENRSENQSENQSMSSTNVKKASYNSSKSAVKRKGCGCGKKSSR